MLEKSLPASENVLFRLGTPPEKRVRRLLPKKFFIFFSPLRPATDDGPLPFRSEEFTGRPRSRATPKKGRWQELPTEKSDGRRLFQRFIPFSAACPSNGATASDSGNGAAYRTRIEGFPSAEERTFSAKRLRRRPNAVSGTMEQHLHSSRPTITH